MENIKLDHEKVIARSDLARLCPAAVKAARGAGFRYFWVNDVAFCAGDPVAITQENRHFSLCAGARMSGPASIWDPSLGKWLAVL